MEFKKKVDSKAETVKNPMKGNNTKKRDSVGDGHIKSNRTTLLWSERHTISISDSVELATIIITQNSSLYTLTLVYDSIKPKTGICEINFLLIWILHLSNIWNSKKGR